MTTKAQTEVARAPVVSLAEQLASDVLIQIVSGIQARLYLDVDDGGQEFWNPAKDWSCCDVCQDVQDLLHRHGLVPGDEQPVTFKNAVP